MNLDALVSVITKLLQCYGTGGTIALSIAKQARPQTS